jgi:TIR domain
VAPMSRAFVSYVREDATAVAEVANHLVRAGVPLWYDVSELVGGVRWKKEIRMAIEAGSAFLAFFSSASERREQSYMREELLEAIAHARLRSRDRPWLIPVRLDPCALPDLDLGGGETLRDLQYIDMFDPNEEHGIEQLIVALQTARAFA